MTKKEAKDQIKRLIAKYEKLTPIQRKKYNEATTRKDFILPLFHALGWDVYNNFNSNEVVEEESVVEGTVDYTFRLNDIPQFLLEAKALKVDLDKIQWAKQAESYAWNMGIDWVILTDFEGLKLFNAEWKKEVPRPNLEFTYKEYLTRFDDLWLFSRESFQKGLLNKEAEKWGIKSKRMMVTEKLAKDLTKWREKLFNNLYQWNEGKYTEEEIDEAVQRILDRFIFIRSCEDRGIEEKKLWPAFKKWESDKVCYNFMKALRPIFKEFDEKYNSNLFTPHFCEDLDTEGQAFSDVINDLYGDKELGVKYNFAVIKPDILGAVYEQYLGHLLEKAKESKLAEKTKRKRQGIYYTPTFIVDYIVENTLGKLIKEKSLIEIENLKILDPACGSGSFLIKAFDVLDKKIKEERNSRTSSDHAYRKYRILTNNLYGVDLDDQAIEITRLNLLLKALEPKHKLPLLSENTKVGNSLISGTENELKKYFGKDWRKKKPFNWEKEFPDVFEGKNPGFDVIIGNPPWGADIDDLIEYFEDHYPHSTKQHKDIFKVFIEKAINLLKDGGIFGFIVPNTILLQPRFQDIREFLNQYQLLYIVNLGEKVFKGVEAPSCIIICRKLPKTKDSEVKILDLSYSKDNEHRAKKLLLPEYSKIKQSLYESSPGNAFIMYFKEIKKDEVMLGEILDCRDAGIKYQRIGVGMREKGKNDLAKRLFYEGFKMHNNDKKFIIGKDIDRYYVNLNKNRYLRADYKKFLKKNEIVYFNKKYFEKRMKILWRQTSDIIRACIVRRIWFANTLQVGVLKDEYKDKINLYYILALLNSKYLNYLYAQIVKESGRVFPQVKLSKIKQLPIKIVSKKKQIPLVKLAKKMLKLNKELQKITEKSDKWYKIKKEIEKTDKLIDQKVYKLYELTEEEIKIVENSSQL